MAETIMTFSLGFLIASLVGLALAAPMWRRAVRLTTKRLRTSSPVSVEDFNADKDRLRAEFAVSTRKLEMSVDSLRKKAEARLGELDLRNREIAELKADVETRIGQAGEQSAEIERLRQHLATTEAALKRREDELADLQTRLAEAQAVLTRQASAIREVNSLVEGQKMQIGTITEELDEQTREAAEKAADLKATSAQLAKCGRTVAEQKMLVSTHEQRIAELTATVERLTAEASGATARAETAESHVKNAATARHAAEAAAKTAETEIATLKAQLARQREAASERAQVEAKESAHLRQRLTDLATEIEAMSGTFDGLADAESGWNPKANLRRKGQEAAADAKPATPAAVGTTLAQRIRALQGSLGTH